MYEKKLRELFQESKENAEQALEEEDSSTAASYYEKCGDILMEQAKNSSGKRKENKEELAQEYYELRDNLLGKSSSMKREVEVGDEEEFSGDAERFIQQTNISWEDVAGLEETKKELKESFALAAIEDKPGAVEQLHTILLYGPPGTGKSLLASAIAGSHDYPFFNVKLSQALSKYYGESGKIISSLFETARERSPSIVFFDEMDSVAFSRGGQMDEASRRVLSTLLTELSGFDTENEEVMFIGATNAPWDLDPAVLSRMERTVYVPLPDRETVKRILELNTREEGVDVSADLSEVAERCVSNNFSGREVKNLAQDAVRRMVEGENQSLESLSEKSVDEIKDYDLKTRPLTLDHFENALDNISPKTDTELLEKYRDWDIEY
ncbi:MAG: ATP-binding protein [Candidatus Nanohaloarchaeota archaeon QJJ-7]|nr:ATP-binding protein [Candidatus Nanohaloarchaeota archaeon QJJ-7]